MQVTADMISTRSGSILPLDQRRRDALANYCEIAARQADMPVQTWIRKTFGFEVYEAKEVIRGNASEALWERIVKHPNGGWSVVLPIMGAVIGHSVDEYIAQERSRLRNERRVFETQDRRLAEMGRDLRLGLGVGRVRPDQLGAEPPRSRGSRRG